MMACVIHGAKELKVENRPEPRPQEGEVLIRFGAGGICGSDLHYYHEGRVGDFAVREPMVLGHEVAGEVVAAATNVTKIQAGQRVAVNPTRACLRCYYCLSGRSNLCRNVRFFGSAARFPHVQGAFAELFTASEEQCVPIPESLSYRVAACAEPLAVTLHAVSRGGQVLGRRVLVTGAGPIGVLVVASARLAGAAEIVVTDLFDEPLAIAKRMGATRVANVKVASSELEAFAEDGGRFDVAIEVSGNARALENCIDATKPGGRIVQVGLLPAGNSGTPVNKITVKELELVGTFRFHEEFQWAVDALVAGRIDVEPILSGEFTFSEAISAFELASDRRKAMKVSLVA
ncbi:MAG TPA: L-idonate 5-dehydrogenase [Chthoniobacterales bacterium]|jgi:L-idonate 5-dehydrogenase